MNDSLAIEDRLSYRWPMVAVSLSDLYSFLSDVGQLFGLDFTLPQLTIFCERFDHKFKSILHPLIRTQSLNKRKKVSISVTHEQLLTISGQPEAHPIGKYSFNFKSGLSVENIHDYLTYIAQSIFRYSGGTKANQEKVLKAIFDGQDVFGIYPTGSGKSFCFWLPALLKPGLSIVICPLRSLMRDQRLTIENYGIASVDFINSDVNSEEQRRIVNDAMLGKIKLLYISPERLRIKKFVEELKGIQEFVDLNYLIIDEAHCISEWGHDFRPSYLNIPTFYEQLKDQNSSVQLIALTATAGQMVEKDITNLLQPNCVLKERDLDRRCFSYQIDTVNGYEEKKGKFHEVMTKSIPKALSHYIGLPAEGADIHQVVNSKNKKGERGLGIIYVVYADPHGKHSTADGLAHYLYETKKIVEPQNMAHGRRQHRAARPRANDESYSLDAYGTGKVRAFSSKPPTLCPRCRSYDYVSQQVDDEGDFELDDDTPERQPGMKICRNCRNEFHAEAALTPNNYDKMTLKNQDDFKRSGLDILVATKGFGMGIDKSSVRFVLHTTPSSSIESWYQEVGRAGRDEERAHCTAIVDAPSDNCLEELSNVYKKVPRCNWRAGCPYGKDGLCDYGKQHMFIKHSYAGVVPDVVSAVRTLDKLIASFINEEKAGESVRITTSRSYLKNHELALFRLKLLGIVEDFSVTYARLMAHFDVAIRTAPTSDGKVTIWTDAEEIKNKLRQHIDTNNLFQANNEALASIDDRIRECKQKYDTEILRRLANQTLTRYQQFQGFYHKIVDYLLVLLDHTYENIVRMRYDMLWNLYQGIILNHADCRRTAILDYLAERNLFDDRYRCGLCDNCVDDLEFTVDSRIPPPKTDRMDELEQELEKAFAASDFDYARLIVLVEAFREYPSSTYRRARAILEGSPKNLVALYLAREFSPSGEKEANTFRLIETANRSLDMDMVIRLYESSANSCKPQALLLLDDEFGQFNNSEGIQWLYSEAGKELARTEDGELQDLHAILLLVAVHEGIEARHYNRLPSIKHKLEEVYYG